MIQPICIFIHNPKAAGTYIKQALNAHEIGYISLLHNTADTMKGMYGDVVWRKAYKFAFVRNPWDRLVSWYYFIIQTKIKPNIKRISFPEFINIVCDDDSESLISQSAKLYPSFWKTILDLDYNKSFNQHAFTSDVDFIGRFENFNNDLKTVMYALGAKQYLSSPPQNTSTHKNYHEYYTPELVKKVEKKFQKDIELFGYTYTT